MNALHTSADGGNVGKTSNVTRQGKNAAGKGKQVGQLHDERAPHVCKEEAICMRQGQDEAGEGPPGRGAGSKLMTGGQSALFPEKQHTAHAEAHMWPRCNGLRRGVGALVVRQPAHACFPTTQHIAHSPSLHVAALYWPEARSRYSTARSLAATSMMDSRSAGGITRG